MSVAEAALREDDTKRAPFGEGSDAAVDWRRSPSSDVMASPYTAVSFGRFELHPASRELRLDGKPVPIGARAFDVLQTLIERRERLVTKNELLDLVWPGVVVEENNIQVQISALRKLLGPNAIATIPGRGYRFTATVLGRVSGRERQQRPAADPVGDASATPLSNLPRELPLLYGRAADIATASSLADKHRLVTIVGAGGIGKSRLAQAVAHDLREGFDDGAWMVELAGLSDPDLVANTIASSLHVSLTSQRVAQDELIAGVAERRMLLVLDNCEHLLDAVASVADALLRAAPGLRILATSQEPLRLPEEQQLRLMPLAVPVTATVASALDFGALALLEARVRATAPRFALNDQNLDAAIDICRRLDGLPLAIELAAARVATIGLAGVRDKLDARFRLLTGGARTNLRRHQTLRAALEWSHNLLGDDEQRVFRRLGVFSGGFTVETAQAVASDERLDEWAVLDHLSALVDKSLVVVDAGDPPRYRLLESARAFALEKLAAAEYDETSSTLARHVRAMRAFIERVDDANLDGHLRSDQYATLVLPELDNLRAAFSWASGTGDDAESALAIAAHSGSLIDYANECAGWLLSVQEPNDGVDEAVVARYWRAMAATNMVGHVANAAQADAAERARALYQKLGHPRRVFSSLIQLVRRIRNDDLAAAGAAADEARRLIEPDWPAEFRLLLLRLDAQFARMAQRFDTALALHQEEVRVADATGDWRLQVIARSNMSDILWQMGSLDEAARYMSTLIGELRARPSADTDMATAYSNAIGILAELGRIDDASAIALDALHPMRRSSEYYLEEWAYLFWRRGQFDIAARLIGAYDAKRLQSTPSQVNEQRLIDRARLEVERALTRDVMAGLLAAGATLGKTEMHALISEGLATR